MDLVKVENLHVTFTLNSHAGKPFGANRQERVQALKGINLSLKKGDKLVVIGRNGSGKSTFLRVLAGAFPATKGLVDIVGEKLSLLNRYYGLLPTASLHENAMLKALSLGLDFSQAKVFANTAIKQAGLESKSSHPLNTLSAGMSGRFNLMLNTQMVKPIMILDEWVGEMDAGQTKKKGLLSSLATQSDIMILATHNETLARNIANKVLLLHHGEQVYFGGDLDFAFSSLDSLPNHFSEKSKSLNQEPLETAPTVTKIVHPPKTARFISEVFVAAHEQLDRSCDFEIYPRNKLFAQSDQFNGSTVFVVRHPIERAARAFRSRRNQGGPHYFLPWSTQERRIFNKYKTIDELLLSFELDGGPGNYQCVFDLLSIDNVRSSLQDVFGVLEDFDKIESDKLTLVDAVDIIDYFSECSDLPTRAAFMDSLSEADSLFITPFYNNEISEHSKRALEVIFRDEVTFYNKLYARFRCWKA